MSRRMRRGCDPRSAIWKNFRLDLLPRMGVKRTARELNYEWLDAIDVVNMIETCELIIRSSLERTESRGPFMRRDYPEPIMRNGSPRIDG